ncbi:hypothetical protein D3C80_1274930 [compost metagenome]
MGARERRGSRARHPRHRRTERIVQGLPPRFFVEPACISKHRHRCRRDRNSDQHRRSGTQFRFGEGRPSIDLRRAARRPDWRSFRSLRIRENSRGNRSADRDQPRCILFHEPRSLDRDGASRRDLDAIPARARDAHGLTHRSRPGCRGEVDVVYR